MRKLTILFLICTQIIILISLTGCTTRQTLFVQNAEVFGPINQTAIHLTDSTETPAVTFSPWFSYNTQKSMSGHIDGHSLVNENGIFQVDTTYSGSTVTYNETP